MASGSDRNATSNPSPSARLPGAGDHSRALLFALAHGGKVQLHVLQLHPAQTSATTMYLLKREYKATRSLREWFRTRLVIEDATISPLCVGDPEAQDYPREVIVETTTPRSDLAEAFKNPRLLRGPAFVSMSKRFMLAFEDGDHDCAIHAILIRAATSRATVAFVLVAVILFSAIVGLAAGMLTGDAKIGLAVCAGAIAIFALIQASMCGVDSMKSKASC